MSHAVNRRAFADAVFLGAAEPQWGPITPSNTTWFAPATARIDRQAYDMGRARVLLAGLGLRDTNNDGMLEDAAGAPARFSLVTQKGNTALEKGAAFIRDELKKVGLARRRGAARSGRAGRPHDEGRLRRPLLPLPDDRHRPGDEPGLLAQLRRRPRVEHGAGGAGHAVGEAASTR